MVSKWKADTILTHFRTIIARAALYMRCERGKFDQGPEQLWDEVRGETGIHKSLYLHQKCYLSSIDNRVLHNCTVASEVHPVRSIQVFHPSHSACKCPVSPQGCFPAFPWFCSSFCSVVELYIHGIMVCLWRCHLNAEHLIALVKQNKPN